MKGSPAVPGGSLESKPTWPIPASISAASVFFLRERVSQNQDWAGQTPMGLEHEQ
jgi:hypothetical protein